MIRAAQSIIQRYTLPKRLSGESQDRNSLTRTAMASRRARLTSRPGWITSIITESRSLADELVNDTSVTGLQENTNRLRHYRLRGTPIDDQPLLTLATAAVIAAVRRSLSLNLFDVQIHAGLVVSQGAVAEMQTGEGKTLSGILPAYLHSLLGRGVHVATTTDYLAKRDCEKLSAVFASLGVTTGLLNPNASLLETQTAYQADVTYGPGHAFGFDYLRDRLVQQQHDRAPTGSATLAHLADRSRGNDRRQQGARQQESRQRGLHCAIVDEIDHVLIDDAISPLLLSSSSDGEAADANIHFAAKELATSLQQDVDFQMSPDRQKISLTSDGYDRIYSDCPMATHDHLARPWHEYVVLALRANRLFRRDVDYIVKDDTVQIVDTSTGRIYADRSWSDGLQQAVEAAEGVRITPETKSLASITRQRFYRMYGTLGGMSGTAANCKNEFAKVYGMPVQSIPTRLEPKRKLLPDVIVKTQEEKYAAIARDVKSIHQQNRPILIGTLNIAQSQHIAQLLCESGLRFELLNGTQDADEAAIIAAAGRCGAITVATNMAGRGTDIQLDEQAIQLGGLHVILVERHRLARVDRQLIGRCARCGDPGTATKYLSADDTLPSVIAPWIGRSIERNLGRSKRSTLEIERALRKEQQSQQKRAAETRMQLLKSDDKLQDLYMPTGRQTDPFGCCQL
ncbi:preprotein translocase subunit SecA [Planctomycetes bacterium K23_9]|uniref:Protein translocase subunit SecA n=1 Tax=Stieleria marina TaxID=1930275 RepID=A0A517NY09_9BACT|nr:preprotein translocase subunit SecA [Planctomycetes bacterium K23_9]